MRRDGTSAVPVVVEVVVTGIPIRATRRTPSNEIVALPDDDAGCLCVLPSVCVIIDGQPCGGHGRCITSTAGAAVCDCYSGMGYTGPTCSDCAPGCVCVPLTSCLEISGAL